MIKKKAESGQMKKTFVKKNRENENKVLFRYYAAQETMEKHP